MEGTEPDRRMEPGGTVADRAAVRRAASSTWLSASRAAVASRPSCSYDEALHVTSLDQRQTRYNE
jgi:hypothetical protein